MPARWLNMWPHWPLHSRSCDLHDLRRCHERHEVHTGRSCMVLTRILVLHTMRVPVHLYVHQSLFCHSVMGRSGITGHGVTLVSSHLSFLDIKLSNISSWIVMFVQCRSGTSISQCWCQLIILHNFRRKLHENERIWTPSVDSPLQCFFNL